MSNVNGMGPAGLEPARPVKYAKGLRIIFRIKKINRIRIKLMMLNKW